MQTQRESRLFRYGRKLQNLKLSSGLSHASSYGRKKSAKKQVQRKDPRSVTKEITVSVKIAEHDLAVKVNHMWEFLEKKHSVKLWVKTKVRRQEYLATERKKQLRMLEDVAKSLEDVAVRQTEQNLHRNRLVCTFRPL